MIPNLLDLQPNKVSVDLTQYSMIIMGDTGVGKTMAPGRKNCTARAAK